MKTNNQYRHILRPHPLYEIMEAFLFTLKCSYKKKTEKVVNIRLYSWRRKRLAYSHVNASSPRKWKRKKAFFSYSERKQCL